MESISGEEVINKIKQKVTESENLKLEIRKENKPEIKPKLWKKKPDFNKN